MSLTWKAPEGQKGKFEPYVLPLPVNLWGRDIMQHLGLTLSNEKIVLGEGLNKAKNMMLKMGYRTGKGLGRSEQGGIEPISPVGNIARQGLGFS